MKRQTIYKTLAVIAMLIMTVFSVSAEKKADSNYVRSARSVDISNEYGTAAIILFQGYGEKFIFQTFRGNIDKEFIWSDLSISVADQIIIKGKNSDGNDCKMTILPDGKNYSIWIDVISKSGKRLEDIGISEIGLISFAVSAYDFRKSKNVKTGFKLLKEWITTNYM